MREIRILVVGAPGILRDVVVDLIRRCADMTIVDVGTDLAAVARPSPTTAAADVVLCTVEDAAVAETAAWFLEPCGRAKVIALRDDGRRTVLWEVRPRRVELGELSPPQLLRTIRGGSQ